MVIISWRRLLLLRALLIVVFISLPIGGIVPTRARLHIKILQREIPRGLPGTLVIGLIEAVVGVEHLLDFAVN